MKATTAVTKVTTAPLAKALATAIPPATTAKPTPIPISKVTSLLDLKKRRTVLYIYKHVHLLSYATIAKYLKEQIRVRNTLLRQ